MNWIYVYTVYMIVLEVLAENSGKIVKLLLEESRRKKKQKRQFEIESHTVVVHAKDYYYWIEINFFLYIF